MTMFRASNQGRISTLPYLPKRHFSAQIKLIHNIQSKAVDGGTRAGASV